MEYNLSYSDKANPLIISAKDLKNGYSSLKIKEIWAISVIGIHLHDLSAAYLIFLISEEIFLNMISDESFRCLV